MEGSQSQNISFLGSNRCSESSGSFQVMETIKCHTLLHRFLLTSARIVESLVLGCLCHTGVSNRCLTSSNKKLQSLILTLVAFSSRSPHWAVGPKLDWCGLRPKQQSAQRRLLSQVAQILWLCSKCTGRKSSTKACCMLKRHMKIELQGG